MDTGNSGRGRQTGWYPPILLALCFFLLSAIFPGQQANAQASVTFAKQFSPDSIVSGQVSKLQFTIFNDSATPVTGLAFVDDLPAGVAIANPAAVSLSNCDGGGSSASLSAVAGGSSITFADGALGVGQTCTASVNVTSSTIGSHVNVTGDLTSSSPAANYGAASDTLDVVAASGPLFSKSFSPSAVNLGEQSQLTFTIDNSAGAGLVFGLNFADSLPSGMEIADPAFASTTCGGAIYSAPAGGTAISFVNGFVAAGESCIATVFVRATTSGTLVNTTGNLTSSAGNSGQATATLTVNAPSPRISLAKSFIDDPAHPGGTVTLEFTVQNTDRDFTATGIGFTDDLDAALSGLAATGLPASDVCGAGSSLSGTSVLTLAGASLSAASSCTFSVTLQLPAGAASGNYINTTSSISATIDGSPVTGNPASDILVVEADAPLLTKTFLTDPVGAGDTATVEFTITNQVASTITAITFSDEVSAMFSSVVGGFSFPSDPCGAGSSVAQVSFGTDRNGFVLSSGSLAANASCTFSVDFTVPLGTPPGTYTNTTGNISATVSGNTETGGTASDTLTIADSPASVSLAKSFTGTGRSFPGGTATMEFRIVNGNATSTATGISFTDDLDAFLSGAVATGLPASDICGVGSQISGTSSLTFSAGVLAAQDECTFSVSIQVPGVASPGTYTNTTSDLTASTGGAPAAVTGSAASADLIVDPAEPPMFSKEFIDDPVIPGATATLRFTIDNSSADAADATSMSFTDNLNAVLSGLAAVAPLPVEPCGTGSAIAGTSTLIFSGGNLTAGTSCTFDITVSVPGAAASGTYPNTTSNLAATVGGTPLALPPATDSLVVESAVLLFSKSFTDDPVFVGDAATLEFTVTNSASSAATAISFTDDLDAMLSGVVATGLPASDVCGAGSQISGTGLLTLTGGNLGAGASCTFSVSVQVPGAAAPGTYTNTTSQITGTMSSLVVTGDPAIDQLTVVSASAPTLSKVFTDDPAGAGGTVTLQFTIENPAGGSAVAGLSFTDDLDAMLSGAVATGLPANDICGAGSQLSGVGALSFTGGNLTAGASCTFSVTVQLPAVAAPGDYGNTTSNLFQSGIFASGPATDTLTIATAPSFAKSFSPASITTGGISTLTFAIDNSAAAVAATALAFTDNMPAALAVAASPNASTTCTGGTLSAVSRSTVISYTGGSVAAGSTCTISVDVTSLTVGSHVNTTGDLTSSLGNSGTATDTLVVTGAPGTITIAATAGPDMAGDGTFNYTSADPDLNAISLTTVGGAASSLPISKAAAAYTISQDAQADWSLDSISCAGDTDGGSVVDLPNRSVTIDLDDGEAIVCTFVNIRNADAVIRQTHAVILEFMERRADQITANGPGLTDRLRNRGKKGPKAGTLQGEANSLVSSFKFSSSLGEVRSWHANLIGGVPQQPSKFDVWIDARFAHSKTDTSKTRFGLLYLGADYLINDDLLVGGIVQLDWAGLDSRSANTTADGFGWMAGPYFVARPWQNIYVDGRFAWGQSDNEVNPLGLYTDDFDTERWLASGRITGDYFHGGLRISPAAEVVYFRERQEAYVDSLNIAIPSQTLSLGRLIFGPELSYDMALENGAVLSPSLKFEGIWDFHREVSASSTATLANTGDLRARINLGLAYTASGGMSVSARGFYDGIGASGYDTYGGMLEISLPLQ